MITVTPRNPFQILMIAAFGLYCIAGLIAFDRIATSTLRSFPQPWGMVFLAVAGLACSIALTGTIRSGSVRGVLLERAGLTGLAGVAAAYAVWGLAGNGLRGLAFALMLSAIAIASAWRIAQIEAARRGAVR